MSKNIIIQEGGIGKQMTVKKLKTDTVGGGSVLWVPEDEVSLGTKSISANGTYKASDDGKYGFSQVTVNVAGAAGSANPDGTPTTNPNIGGGTVDPGTVDPGTGGGTDPGTVDPGTGGGGTVDPGTGGGGTVDPGTGGGTVDPGTVDPGTVDPSTGGSSTWIPPGGPGSGVVGTDPEDGNEYFIGIDENGNIVKTKVPSSIAIGKAPDKTSYIAGETIDYSGIIVTLKGGDSAIFSNTDYPNGRIPYNELIFPTSIAPETTGDVKYTSDLIEGEITTCSNVTAYKGDKYSQVSLSGGAIGVVTGFKPSHFEGITACKDRNGVQTRATDNVQDMQVSFSQLNVNTYEHNGKTVYYIGWLNPYYSNPDRIEPTPTQVNDTFDKVAWTIVYGTITDGVASIPVQWRSPYDGRTFEASFEITVTGSSSGSGKTDGGGYSDDSGGSSPRGGTGF